MKNKKYQILCPEYVPLENKGEEAIIRGTMDVVFPNNDCEYHIIDVYAKRYIKKGNIHVHPGALFFSDWRSKEFNPGLSIEQIYSSLCSLLRNGLNKFFSAWIKRPHKQAVNLRKYFSGTKEVPSLYKTSIEELKKIDFIIAGHNGGLNEYVCHILYELNKLNYSYGIFGSSMKPKVKEPVLLSIYRKAFLNSKFNIARNPIGFRWAVNNFHEINFELKPDPAFGMVPSKDNEVDTIIEINELNDFFNRPVVLFTTAEPAPITRFSFDNYSSTSAKIKAHRKFLSEFLKLIIINTNVNILFLPHTIGPTLQMDDRLISKDVIRLANLQKNNRVKLLNADLGAKELKGIIKKGDFIVAERVHSIIGAIGVHTPFMSLASKHDTRIEGIIKEQMKLGELIYYLNNPTPDEAFSFFLKHYKNKLIIKERLSELDNHIQKELQKTGNIIRNIIISTSRKEK